MFFRVYLVVLTTCVLCLILLMHFEIQSENESTARLNFTNKYYQQENKSSSSSEERSMGRMGDPRRSSNNSVKSDKSSTEQEDHSKDHFDIVLLNDHLKVCIRESDNEVGMDEYIFVFQQLYKFFILLGTVFGFVGSDVKGKIEILQGYRAGENRTHYETVEKMLQFEKDSDYINTNKESSGSRTLLRLHRALNFVSKFLDKVDGIKDSDGTSHVCKEAYTQTLSKFHPWLIQKGAILAMYALPIKKDLINRVSDGRIQPEEVKKLLHDVIQGTENVYNQCETVYRENEMLDLP